ncbi:MAG: HD domain-containing phosphohydrolase [Pseudomonadota bacterium]
MTERYDEHYIASVAAMGDTHAVSTTQAIFTRNGIKLIDAGTRINSALREKLVQHKLIPDIDQCLVVENGVTNTHLRDAARTLLREEACLDHIRNALPGLDRVLNAFYAIPLNAPLAFKLTVAREQHPQLFRHSLLVAIVAVFLGLRSRMSDRELAAVATAGMFHDLGELHIDPHILGSADRLDAAALRQISVHPTTAYMILQEYPQYHPEISKAVFEHHERMDGSGYPRGLKGDEISPIGQILMLAEVIATLSEKSWEAHGTTRLSMMLKMNRRRFAPALIDHIAGLLQPETENGSTPPADVIVKQLDDLAEVFRLWHAVHASDEVPSPLAAFVGQRVVDVERSLLETGFQPNKMSMLIDSMRDDEIALMEMHLMLRESRWMIANVIKETQRRWNDLVPAGQDCVRVREWIEKSGQLLQDEGAAR